MATLSWTNLNPTVKIVDTKKKFFSRYLYKIVLYVPGCRLVTTTSDISMQNQLDRRLQMLAAGNFRYLAGTRPTWGSYSRISVLRGASTEQLEYFKDIIQSYDGQIKVRIEEPNLTLYADNEDILFDIAKAYTDSLIEIHRPSSLAAAEALDRGECILKKPIDYTHKVVFKESAQLSMGTKTSIYDYLINLGDTVKMTKGCQRNLTENRYWFTSTYFYTKDESVLTFLNLIAPGSIAGIYKLALL